MRVGLLSLVAVLSVTAAAVTMSLRPSIAEPAPIPPLSATLEIRRTNLDLSTVSIEVANEGDVPVTVRSAELLSDSFESPGPQDVDVEVPDHAAARDIKIEYGTARCDDQPSPEGAPGTARLEVSTDGRHFSEVLLELPHPDGVMDRLLSERCGEAFLAKRVAVSLGEWEIADDDTLHGHLILQRVEGDEPIELFTIAGSILYTLTPDLADGDTPIGELAGDDSRQSFDVIGDTSRCDAHGLADVKKPFAFNAWISIGGSEPIATPIPITDTDVTKFTQMLERRCVSH